MSRRFDSRTAALAASLVFLALFLDTGRAESSSPAVLLNVATESSPLQEHNQQKISNNTTTNRNKNNAQGQAINAGYRSKGV